MKRIVMLGTIALTTIVGPAAGAADRTAEPQVSQGECEEGGGKAGRNADGKLECIGGKYDGAPIVGF
jgi:hypothetical protein